MNKGIVIAVVAALGFLVLRSKTSQQPQFIWSASRNRWHAGAAPPAGSEPGEWIRFAVHWSHVGPDGFDATQVTDKVLPRPWIISDAGIRSLVVSMGQGRRFFARR